MRWAFTRLLRGFTTFVEGARLLWARPELGRLALRLRDPKASVDVSDLRDRHPTMHGPIPNDVAQRVRHRYERLERTLSWDAEPPKHVRYEYLPLRSDPRPGEYQIGALLPTNEDDSLNLTEPIRFWVVVSDQAPDDGRYRRFADDRFAGPLEA